MSYNLAEFRIERDRLSDYVVWVRLIAPGIILNKDGSFQTTFRYRGPDLDSATREELISISARLNNVLKRLSGGWAFYAEAQRRKSRTYLKNEFTDRISQLIDDERREYFSQGNHYESTYYFTLVYIPPFEAQNKLLRFLFEAPKNSNSVEEYGKYFIAESNKIFGHFAEILPEAEFLTDDETLTYLHSCISEKYHPVKTPEIPMYLDSFLYDSPLSGDIKLMLGKSHLRVVSLFSFPGSSVPGLLNNLNELDFEYRWISRFIALDKLDADKELKKYRKLWKQESKSMYDRFIEAVSNKETTQLNEDALLKSDDAMAASLELNNDSVNYGFYTFSVVILDKDENQADKKAALVEKTLNSMGYVAQIETVNSHDAWMGTIPAMCRNNIRRPPYSTISLVHTLPVSAIWAGPEHNKHLKAPCLLHTETAGNTPFRLDLYVGDVGHTLIVGPTGAGKSVLLSLLTAQYRKYKSKTGLSQIYFFDKGSSSRALTLGTGGTFYHLANEEKETFSFQPLALIDDENERMWAAEWIYDFLRSEEYPLNPESKNLIWSALNSLAKSPVEERSITDFYNLVQSSSIKSALMPLMADGSFGNIFDAKQDGFTTGTWQVFEMETLMNTPAAVAPALSYLFRRIEKSLRGQPTLIVLDECWLFFKNPIFEDKIKEWLKVLRKANAAVVFATQSLSDIAESKISSAIIESCKTSIFLPNAQARNPEQTAIYRRFGLNSREIDIISMATPKRHYYYKSESGSRLFELALGSVSLAYCGSSSKEDQRMMDVIISEHGKENFNKKWLEYKGLKEKAALF